MTITLDILTRAKQHDAADQQAREAIEHLTLAASMYHNAGKPLHAERMMREASRLRRLRDRLKLVA